MIDDGKELLCCFLDSIAYREIKTDSSGHMVCLCPREADFNRKSGLADYRVIL